jgi:biotin carboxylase
MRKRLVILGAGIMQTPAIGIARELGFESVVVDGDPNAPYKDLACRFECIDLKDKEGILALAEGLKAEEGGLAGIMTAGTDFSASVAFVAERLGLPGIPYEAALDASDKERMRRRFAAAGAPSPEFVIVGDGGGALGCSIPYPVVVKPVDNMGARGCRRASCDDELRVAVAEALRFSRSSRVIVEEFIDGPEFSIDAIVFNGEITVCGLADRHIFFPPYFIEMGHTMPAALAPETAAALIDVFASGVRALGIANGAAKGDLKLSSAGPMIGEIAARLSGGFMSGWTHPYASGANATMGALLVAVGEKPRGMTAVRDWTSAERAFISIPGLVRSIRGLEKAERMRWVKDVFPRVRPGDRVSFPENNVSKCGNVISAAPARVDAIVAAESAVRGILIRLCAPDAATDAFLASPLDSSFPPSAFQAPPSVAGALERLPETYGGAAPPRLVAFPELMGSGLKDYVGRGVAECLDAVRELTGEGLPPAPDGAGGAVLGRGFWRALVRGGCQGAAYYIDRGAGDGGL